MVEHAKWHYPESRMGSMGKQKGILKTKRYSLDTGDLIMEKAWKFPLADQLALAEQLATVGTLADQLATVGRTGRLAYSAQSRAIFVNQEPAQARDQGAGSSARQSGGVGKRRREVGERSISAKRAKKTRDDLVNVNPITAPPDTSPADPSPSLRDSPLSPSLRDFPLWAYCPPPPSRRPSPPVPEGQGDDVNALLQLWSLCAASPQVSTALSSSPAPRPSPPVPDDQGADVNSFLHIWSLLATSPQVSPALPPSPPPRPSAPVPEGQAADVNPVVEVSISGYSPAFSRDPSPSHPVPPVTTQMTEAELRLWDQDW
jgi:hypothetical protein